MYELRQHKTEIRTAYMEKRANMPAEERAAKNAAVCKSVLASATYRFADTLLLYYPREDEVDVLPIARAALEAGKKVAFPKCHPADKSMDFHFVSSVEDFEKGEYDIMEPVNSLGIYNKENSLRDNCICIVPAVVYDKKGYRIGYGGGYYDRYLSGFRGTVVGIAYRDFILPNVPHGRFDVAVDVLISEGGIYAKS